MTLQIEYNSTIFTKKEMEYLKSFVRMKIERENEFDYEIFQDAPDEINRIRDAIGGEKILGHLLKVIVIEETDKYVLVGKDTPARYRRIA